MGDRTPRDPWDLSRLGDEDFVSEPLVPGRARRIDDDADEEFLAAADYSADEGKGRRLSAEERRALQRRARERRKVPEAYFGREQKKRRWPRWGGVALILLVIIIAGNWSLFGGSGKDDPPADTPTAIPTDPPTEAAIAIVASPTEEPTATPAKTATPTEEPSPTPEPTADPRFKGEVICLDPGHGGWDTGYTREANAAAPALREADVNLENAKALKKKLEGLGFKVVMTRDSDQPVNADGSDVNGDGMTYDNQTDETAKTRARDIDELQARINVCNAANAELLLSMHINGYPDPSVSGYETWFSSARPFQWQNKLIATFIFDELGKSFAAGGYNAVARDVNDDQTANVGMARDVFDRYVITGPDQAGAINASQMPGAIVETLFVSNDSDAAILASEDGRAAIVDGYANGIVDYFNTILGPANAPGQEDSGG